MEAIHAFFASIFQSDAIVNFDWAIYQFTEKLWCPVMDVIMSVITYLGDNGIFGICLSICLFIPKKTRKLGVYVIGGLAVATVINNLGLKELFGRVRPFNFNWPDGMNYVFPDIVEKPHSLSFPSGHTSTSVGAALPFLVKAKKSAGIPVFILALLIGFSRIYVHVHYPTDVLAGAVVGLIAGFLTILLLDKLFFPKVVPAVERKLNKKIF